uniref:Thiosulfate sulfurtransferase GlpE n=1 Tax=Rheinheimera sp. BAL341 TaxID=1708203 RepID=A0A486XNU8_9GAMM
MLLNLPHCGIIASKRREVNMSDFKHISVAETAQLRAERKVVIADIRDENSFAAGHIDGAVHLTNASLTGFMQQYEFDQPVVVVCYHGNSSQGAAQYLAQQGYEQVFSMDGGFESWRRQQPFVSDASA